MNYLCHLQTTIIRSYPAELIVTFICCGFVGIQSFVVAVIAERNPSAWRLRPDLELIAILYSVRVKLHIFLKIQTNLNLIQIICF